jgi:chromatin remodeling complex protein RSC6
MSKNTSATSVAKKVTKKSDAAAPVAAAPVAAAPAVAEKVAPKKAAKAAAPVVEAVAAPVAAPVAAAAEVVEQKTVEQEIAALISVHQNLRDQSVAAIKTLQKLQKRVAREVKEAGRRRRRAKKEDENGAPKEKRPTIFTTPVTLKDELCVFLGKAKGSQMTPADVTRAFSAYVDSHKLKDADKGHTIHPDAAMRKVLGLKENEEVSYRNVQKYLYKLYVLPEKKAVSKQ